MSTKASENAKTLAAALGCDEQEAERRLALSVLVTAKDAELLADDVCVLLRRTVAVVARDAAAADDFAVEIVVGPGAARSSAPAVLFVDVGVDGSIVIDDEPVIGGGVVFHRVQQLLGACYIVAATMKQVFGEGLKFPGQLPLRVQLRDVAGDDVALLNEAVDLGGAVLAGAGAVGNAFLWALRHFDVRGALLIVDPDDVSDGNLNRCLWFEAGDVGDAKASVLRDKAQPSLPRLALASEKVELGQSARRSERRWLKRLIVGVDSRRARRNLQTECPGEVFDASTTDITEVVLHFHKWPGSSACLSCTYRHVPDEAAREEHVADQLGVSLAEVEELLISPAAAQKILAKYPNAGDVVGRAYDSLFKALCGQGALSVENKQVLAPFAFVSVLAGTLLAIETVLRLARGPRYGQWNVSPWSPPNPRLQRITPRRSDCVFCADAIYGKIADDLWGDHEATHEDGGAGAPSEDRG